MQLQSHFPHINLTKDQQAALEKLQTFLDGKGKIFLLKGYAGSGKTTLLKGVVDYLGAGERKCALMAPTGRATKVISEKTGGDAFTIHKTIYSFNDLHELEIPDEEGGVTFVYYYGLRGGADVFKHVFIVDEASMVSDVLSQGEFFRFGSGHLLRDLIAYTRVQDPAAETKIIFIGDPAQLPPIGMNFSPALDENYLSETYSLKVEQAELTEVKRQGGESGILKAATKIRKCLTSGFFNDFDLRANGKDLFNPPYSEFLNQYKAVSNRKIIISYKNKTALDINQQIRKDKYGGDVAVQPGDHIIIGANNYKLGILNGEFGVVVNADSVVISRDVSFVKKKGEHKTVRLIWRRVELLFPDSEEGEKVVTGLMLENYLYGDNFLDADEQRALYVDFKNRFSAPYKAADKPAPGPKSEEFRDAIMKDSYYNAILLKFGYAVTCHKAQGGEWDTAFVFWDRGANDGMNFYEGEQNRAGKTNPDFYRWAYTAITRASRQLHCINPPYFNSFSGVGYIPVNVQASFKELTGAQLAPEEVHLDEDLREELRAHKLLEAPAPLQDHYLAIRHLARKRYADIESWTRNNYEIRYVLKRENDKAGFMFWVNGKDEFRQNFQQIPKFTTSDPFFEELSKEFAALPKIHINRNDPELIVSRLEFDWKVEEERPFLGVLYEHLSEKTGTVNIRIDDIEHHSYRERYSFSRGIEKARVDIEYNGKGFFGRVVPLENHCNSQELLKDISAIFLNLKT